jgi:DNA-binding response OmpR family regulator
MHIAKLRKKIEDRPHDPEFLVTVHRVGYKFTG